MGEEMQAMEWTARQTIWAAQRSFCASPLRMQGAAEQLLPLLPTAVMGRVAAAHREGVAGQPHVAQPRVGDGGSGSSLRPQRRQPSQLVPADVQRLQRRVQRQALWNCACRRGFDSAHVRGGTTHMAAPAIRCEGSLIASRP